jgi:hypothetical protein
VHVNLRSLAGSLLVMNGVIIRPVRASERSGAHAFYRALGMEAVAECFKIYLGTSG